MGFFSTKRKVSKEPVERWDSKDVKAWAKDIGLPKACRTALKPVTGQVLMSMTAHDFNALCGTKPTPIYTMTFMDALARLKKVQGQVCGPRSAPQDLSSGQAATAFAPMHGANERAPVFDLSSQSSLSKGSDAGRMSTRSGPMSEFPAYTSNPHMDPESFKTHHTRNVSSDVQTQSSMASVLAKVTSTLANCPDVEIQPTNTISTHSSSVTNQAPASYGDATTTSAAQSPPGVDISLAMDPQALRNALQKSAMYAPQSQTSPLEPAQSPGGVQVNFDPPASKSAPTSVSHAAVIDQHETVAASPHDAVPNTMVLENVSTSNSTGTVSDNMDSKPDRSPLQGGTYSGALYEHAALLGSFLSYDVEVEDMAEFIKPLPGSKGLAELCKVQPAAGTTFARIFDAYHVANAALCILDLVQHFQEFCVNVLNALGVAGRNHTTVPDTLYRRIDDAISRTCDLFRQFSAPAWFLHIAFMDNVKARFDGAQDAVVNALIEAGAAVLPSGRTLSHGDYTDATRAPRRVLRQVGNGSIADGVNMLACDADIQSSMAAVMGIPLHRLVEDLAQIPAGDKPGGQMDISKVYSHLVSDNSVPAVPEDDFNEHRAIFNWYDDGKKGFLDVADLRSMLLDLGMMEGVKNRDHYVAAQLHLADKSQTGTLSVEEFSCYYSSLVLAGERQQLRRKLGIESEEELKSQFIAFANFSNHGEQCTEMDGARFCKYCTDCKILGKGVTRTDVDLAFAKCKVKGARRITFDQFLRALNLLAARRDVSLVQLLQRCLTFEGPVNHSSALVGNVRLHDDKSTYTGVYARGGPTSIDGPHDLSQITNRKPADNRGVAHAPVHGHASVSTPKLTPRRMTTDIGGRSRLSSGHGGPRSLNGSFMSPSLSCTGTLVSPMPEPSTGRRSGAGRLSIRRGAPSPFNDKSAVTSSVVQLPGWDSLEPLQQVFVAFSLFGKGQIPKGMTVPLVKMDSKAFAKLMKEAAVMEGRLTLTRVDLCFTKCCNKTTKRMDYEAFKSALDACAEARGVEPAFMRDAVAQCEPELRGTIAAQVKWHDDRSTYTGVHAKGGPSTIDKQHGGLEEFVDREAGRTLTSCGRRSMAPSWVG